MAKIAITGANGHLGVRLIRRLKAEHELVAVVRSDKAADSLTDAFPTLKVSVVDYRESDSLAEAIDGCDTVLHLVGIIRESRVNRYEDAHEKPCQALIRAAAVTRLKRIVTVGLLGTCENTSNGCLVSRWRAERILLDGPVPVLVLRVPMVLGEGDFASAALLRNARGLSFTFRSASLEQPIYAGDVVSALVAAVNGPDTGVLELAGPESLSRRSLIHRAASVMNTRCAVISLPILIGRLMAGLLELAMDQPPVTRAMLGVLDHDDDIDPTRAQQALGVELTSLDVMLGYVARPATDLTP